MLENLMKHEQIDIKYYVTKCFQSRLKTFSVEKSKKLPPSFPMYHLGELYS